MSSYANILYSNYDDAIKSSSTYIIGLSSSAIFAFFILLHKFGSDLNDNTILSLKIISFLFLSSLLLTVIGGIVTYRLSYHYHQKFANLGDDIPDMDDDKIKTQVNALGTKVKNSKGYWITDRLRECSFLFFILAICSIGILIFIF